MPFCDWADKQRYGFAETAAQAINARVAEAGSRTFAPRI